MASTTERLRRKLLAQAYLFDDPGAYAAGVEDAFDALARAEEPAPVAASA